MRHVDSRLPQSASSHMWVNDYVDIPEGLLDAQRDGRLVVFAGAGVSMGPPSNLPDFDALAAQIAAGLLEPAASEPFDVFLGRVSSLGVDVRGAHASTSSCRAHPLGACMISSSISIHTEGDVRIVTTNFDQHFTTAAHARDPLSDLLKTCCAKDATIDVAFCSFRSCCGRESR